MSDQLAADEGALSEDALIVCEPGCCEGCEDCLGMGLGCHNRPASRLMAEVRRLGDGEVQP